MTEPNETLGQRMRRLREAKGFSLRDVASMLGVTHGTLSPIENGRIQNPALDRIRGIAGALGVNLWDLTGDAPPATGESPVTMPLSELRVSAFNPRSRETLDFYKDLASLAESIENNGLLVPLTVEIAPYPTRDRLGPIRAWIVTGQRRYLAMQGLARNGKLPLVLEQHVPVHVMDLDPDSRKGSISIIAGLVENLQRSDLTHHDEAAAISMLLDNDADMTTMRIGELIGRTARHVQQRVRVYRQLVDEARLEWAFGTITTAMAEALIRADDACMQIACLADIKEHSACGPITEKFVENSLDLLRDQQKSPALPFLFPALIETFDGDNPSANSDPDPAVVEAVAGYNNETVTAAGVLKALDESINPAGLAAVGPVESAPVTGAGAAGTRC